MTCHEARELFSALIDEALDAGERGAVEAHLETCAECRRELERFRATVSLLRAVEPARAPAGFVGRVLDAARPTPWYRRLLSALFLPWPVKLPAEAAAVVLVAVGVVYLYNATPELQQASQFEPAQAPRETGRPRVTEPPASAAPETGRRAPFAAPLASPPLPQSPAPATRKPMEKDELKDASRDADRQAALAEGRAEGKLEAAQAPEARADAPSAKRQAAAPRGVASFVPPDVSGRLAVSDRDAALRGLDELVARLGAVVDRRLAGSEGPIVEISIAREAYGEFVRELARLGRWQPTREPAELPAQIRIVLRIAG